MADKRAWAARAAIVAAVLVAFSPSLLNEFVYDDRPLLVENERYRGFDPGWAFTTDLMGHYQPLTWLTYSLDYAVWGTDPFGYHLTNVLIHAAAALALFALLRLLLDAGLVAPAAGALFFAIHPMRAESVATAAGRHDVLSGLFLILTLWAYVRMARGSRRWLWAALAFYAVSLLSKSWGFMLPIVLVILDVYPLRRRAWLEKVPFVALAVAAGAMAWANLKAMSLTVGVPWPNRIMGALYGLFHYTAGTAWPVGLSTFYPLETFDPFSASTIAAAGVVAALTILACRRRYALTAWVCFGAMIGPLLGLTQAGMQVVADRYSYLACLPFAALAALGVSRLGRHAWAAALPLAALGVGTAFHVGHWRTETAMWDVAIERTTPDRLCWYSRGWARQQAGDLEGAVADYTQAIALMPEDGLSLNNRGSAYRDLGRFDEALRDHDRAVALLDSPMTWYNRGLDRAAMGAHAAAVADFDRAVALAPGAAAPLVARGKSRTAMGDSGARADFDRAIELDPAGAEAYFQRGVFHGRAGDMAAAIDDFSRAVALAPHVAETYFYRAEAFVEMGNGAAAMRDYSAAIERRPDFAAAYHRRAALQADRSAAMRDLGAAVSVDPANPDYRFDRALLRLAAGDRPGAAADLEAALERAPAEWTRRTEAARLLTEARSP